MGINGLLNSDEAAEILGISRSTLETWRCENRGPKYVKLGPHTRGRIPVRYRLEDLEEYIVNSTRETGVYDVDDSKH